MAIEGADRAELIKKLNPRSRSPYSLLAIGIALLGCGIGLAWMVFDMAVHVSGGNSVFPAYNYGTVNWAGVVLFSVADVGVLVGSAVVLLNGARLIRETRLSRREAGRDI